MYFLTDNWDLLISVINKVISLHRLKLYYTYV